MNSASAAAFAPKQIRLAIRNADCLTDQIPVEHRSLHSVGHHPVGHMRHHPEHQNQGGECRHAERNQKVHREYAVDRIRLLREILSVQKLGAAHHHNAERIQKMRHRRVQADGTHRIRSDRVAGKQAIHDSICRVDHDQQDLIGQKPEEHSYQEMKIRRQSSFNQFFYFHGFPFRSVLF